MQYVFGILMFLTSVFLILLVLVQRGRGGGLAGAFGGMGGQSAFGSKAGDLFTRITLGVAAFWILLCIAALAFMNRTESRFGAAPADGDGVPALGAPGDADDTDATGTDGDPFNFEFPELDDTDAGDAGTSDTPDSGLSPSPNEAVPSETDTQPPNDNAGLPAPEENP